MKGLLAVITLFLSGVVAEAPAPYAPAGFRPAGPAFELPEKASQGQTQPQYLPPLDPRIPSTQYGFPEEDVSVQGLPVVEQRPVFQISPVNGQEYVGPNFNSDIKSLDESYRQSQYQQQQEQYREFERQRQLEAAQARNRGNQQPTPQSPRQAATEPTTPATEATTTNPDYRTTTELDLNEGETLNKDKKDKVTVEVSKQKIQEYPGELFLSSLAQLQLQPQFVPFGQIRAPLYFQPLQQESQKQVAGYDASTHFAAFPSVLAQQQYLQGQGQGFVSPVQQQLVVSGQDATFVQNPQLNYQTPANPQLFTQPAQPFPQPIVVQPQYPSPQSTGQLQNPQNKEEDEEQNDQEQIQFVQQTYQPQEVVYQPQGPAPQYQPQHQPQQGFQPQVLYQPAPQAPVNQYQPQEQQNVFLQAQEGQYSPQEQGFLPQAQLVNYQSPLIQQYQNGFTSQQQNGFAPQQFSNQPQLPQQINQGQETLQSGLDLNQQGNDLEEKEEADDSYQQQPGAVAVATAFGARTQPRVATRYGAPEVPRASANPQTTTEANEETEDIGAVAEANAFSGRRKSAKLRSRRVRPVFTVDRSGHLVLAQQN